MVRREYAQAVKMCRLGLLREPSLLEGRLVLGMALTALGRWDEVLGEMRVALATDSKNALAWLLKSEAHLAKRDYEQAERALEQAKALDPSNTKADQLLAKLRRASAELSNEARPSPPESKGASASSRLPALTDAGAFRSQTETKMYPAVAASASAASLLPEPPTVPSAELRSEPVRRLPIELSAEEPSAPWFELTDGSSVKQPAPPGADELPPLPALLDMVDATLDEATDVNRMPYLSTKPEPASGSEPAALVAPPFGSEEEEEERLTQAWTPRRQPRVNLLPLDEAEAMASLPTAAQRRRRRLDAFAERPPPHRESAPPTATVRVERESASPRGNERPVVGYRLARPARWPTVAAGMLVVIGALTLAGLAVRQWRFRARVLRREELALQKMAAGNYPGFKAAERIYAETLAERDLPAVRARRARVLGQMSLEFGEPTEPAMRAVAKLGDLASADAELARAYLSLSQGELARAAALAEQGGGRNAVDAASSYVLGRIELLQDRPERAIALLRVAAERQPHDALVWHALGLAESAARESDRAREAFQHALEVNANHIATLIDRARLDLEQPGRREAARVALEGVVAKLGSDASPGQLARAQLGLARLELGRADVERARRHVEAAATLRRDGDALLSEELAEAYAETFELDKAAEEARRAVAIGGRLAPRLVLARLALAQGQPTQALTALGEVTGSQPEALAVRARAYLELGDTEHARRDAEAAVLKGPQLAAAAVALAAVEQASGHLDRARRQLERVEHSKAWPEVAQALGQLALAERSPERARRWFREALKRQPLLVEARLALAELLHDGRQLDDAIDEVRQALAVHPEYAPARRELGRLLLEHGDGAAAVWELDGLADRQPEPANLVEAARAHLAIHDAPGAEARAARALKASAAGDKPEDALAVLAWAYLGQHRPGDAVALLRGLAGSARRPETVAALMEAYLGRLDPDRASRTLSLAAPGARNSVEMLLARAHLALARGRDAAAEMLAAQAVTQLRAPRSSPQLKSRAQALRGQALFEQGAFRLARKALDAATQLDGKNPQAFYQLGLVLEELRRPAEARAAMERALAVDPGYSDALYELGRLRAAAGDSRYRDAFQSYLDLAPRGAYAVEAERGLRPTSSLLRTRRRGL